jgi:putative ABC transport system permease protein
MINDFTYALRSLSRSPVFALGAIATLALGIGVNSTIFTLANGALFRAMPGIAAPSELAWVSGLWRDRGQPGGMSYLEYVDYRDRSTELFSNLLAFGPASFSLGSGGEPRRIRGHLVSGSYFSTLGAVPVAGRLLQASDDQPGAAPAAVVSYRLWHERFGAADIVEHPIVINGHQVTVVGVASDGFMGPELGQAADIWLPIAILPVINTAQAGWIEERGTLWLRVMGRLRGGTTMQQAQAALTGVAGALEQAYPDTNKNRTAVVSSAATGVRPSERSELLPIAALLLTVTGLVLLIACANVANLLLARGAGRSLEISIRAAVGASRWRLVRQLLTESLVLAGAGGAAGLLLSFWASDLLVARLPELDFRGLHSSADVRVLLFTAILASTSICAFGLVPALTSTRSALQPRLRETASAGGGRSRLQGIFVVMQLALSLVLLLAAGLSLRALQKAGAIDLGFNPRQVVTASYDLTLQNYPVERRDAFRRDLLARIDSLPAVRSATIADLPPLSGTMYSTVVTSTRDGGDTVEGRAFIGSVGSRYFSTLDIPLVRGRAIGNEDRRGAPGTAVVNETLARQLWPGSDALGRILRVDEGYAVQVIGVARDAKYDDATEDPRPFLYLSLAQHAQLDRETVIVRITGAAALATPLIQAQIRALDPALPVFDVRPFETVLRDRADKQRAISALFAGFGLLALLLASLGLYGVMAYAVTRRTREIGVRLALGATPAQLTRLITSDALRLALTGVAVGAVLALPLASVLGALIFGVQVGDLATFAGTCGLLVAVAMIAALLPARRATRVDPLTALRAE